VCAQTDRASCDKALDIGDIEMKSEQAAGGRIVFRGDPSTCWLVG